MAGRFRVQRPGLALWPWAAPLAHGSSAVLDTHFLTKALGPGGRGRQEQACGEAFTVSPVTAVAREFRAGLFARAQSPPALSLSSLGATFGLF